MSDERRILVAGIGNIFLGDDAFGVEVARRLARRRLSEGVKVVDFGIRGFDLAYALLEDYIATILVDTVQRGNEPGTLYLIEPDLDDLEAGLPPQVETHNIDPIKVLALVAALGGHPGRLYVVGCEPASFGEEQGGRMGLTAPVNAVLDEATEMIEALVQDILNGRPAGQPAHA